VNTLKIELTANEARILGCLMEKSVFTPDQYPLTLNSLTLACNQKSSRDPVMSLDQGTVQHTARQLEDKHLLSSDENFKGRVVKYTQRLCNTPFGEFQFSEGEFAVVCLLLLRGPQTPGELRSRSGRLHKFEDNTEVATTLQGLIEHESGAIVARLPRTPGRLDSEYMHLFFGAIESVAADAEPVATVPSERRGDDRVTLLESRIALLEQELSEVKRILESHSADDAT
jgi:uncharacterized protein YceH (UPF0502 family)